MKDSTKVSKGQTHLVTGAVRRLVPIGVLLWVGFLAIGIRARAFAILGETPLLEYLTSDDLQYWNWAGELAKTRDWVGTEPFFLGPLYPYALATMRLASTAIRDVILLQCLLTSAVVLALTYTVLRIANARMAFAVGTLLASAPMLLLHDMSILAEAFLFALSAALAILPACARLRLRPVTLGALLGGTVGLLALARPAYALLLIPVIVLLHRASAQGRWRGPTVALSLAGLLVLIPTVRHFALGYGAIGITYSGGYNLAIGNGASATGYFVPYASDLDWQLPSNARWEGGTAGDGRNALAQVLGRRPSPLESSRHFVKETVRWCTANPMRWARVTCRKLWWIVQGHELPQVSSIEMFEAVVGALAAPPLWFWAVLIGLCGACVICRAKERDHLYCEYLSWTSGVHVCVMLATFVIDRYKVHMIPALVLLAAASIGRGGMVSASIGRRTVAIAFSACVGAAALTMPPAVDRNQLAFGAFASVGSAYMERQQWQEAVSSFEIASQRLRMVPIELRSTDAGRSGEATLNLDWSTALRKIGRADSASVRVRQGALLMPRSAQLRAAEVVLVSLSGPRSDAIACLARIPADMHEQVRQHLMAEIRSMEGRGEITEMTALMQAMADSWARDEEIVVGLTRGLIVRGDWDEAERRIELARQNHVDAAVCDAHRYAIEVGRGSSSEAAAWLARIPVASRADPRVQATLQLASWIDQQRQRMAERAR